MTKFIDFIEEKAEISLMDLATELRDAQNFNWTKNATDKTIERARNLDKQFWDLIKKLGNPSRTTWDKIFIDKKDIKLF